MDGRPRRRRCRSHRHVHEASIEVLTDGSELTEPCVFLTVRLRRRRRPRGPVRRDVAVAVDVDRGRSTPHPDESSGGSVEFRGDEEDDAGDGRRGEGPPSSSPAAVAADRRRRQRRRPWTDDDDDGGDSCGRRAAVARPHYYRRDDDVEIDDEDDDGGTIASRYCLTGLPSLAGRLSCDQRFNILKGGALKAVLLPCLVGYRSSPPSRRSEGDVDEVGDDHDDGSGGGGRGGEGRPAAAATRGACIAGLPSLFLDLVKAGYGTTPAAAIPPGRGRDHRDDDEDDAEDASDCVDDEDAARVRASSSPPSGGGGLYGDVSVIGPRGTARAIDGIMDAVFGDNDGRRRRPSVRACEVPASGGTGGGDARWWEVHRDTHVAMWGRSVPTTAADDDRRADGRRGGGDDCGGEEQSVVYVVMLLPQDVDDDDDDGDDLDAVPYSFAIIPHGSLPPPPRQRRGGGGRRIFDPLWDALRDLPEEVVVSGGRRRRRRRRRHDDSTPPPPLDFILHLDPRPSVSIVGDDDGVDGSDGEEGESSDDRTPPPGKRRRTGKKTTTATATTDDGAGSPSRGRTRVAVHEIRVPSWATTGSSTLARHHLVALPDDGLPDGGILVRARCRSTVLNGSLPFAFPLSSSSDHHCGRDDDPADRMIAGAVRGIRRRRDSSSGRRRRAEEGGGDDDRIADRSARADGPSGAAWAFGLRSCTSVIMRGWGARVDGIDEDDDDDDDGDDAIRRRPFGFVSRIESIRDRCEGGSSLRAEFGGVGDDGESMIIDANHAKAVQAVECAFRGGASRLCDECVDRPPNADYVDGNEIDLDDSSSDRDNPQVREGDHIVGCSYDLAKDIVGSGAFHQHAFSVRSPHILMLGTGCATPSALRGSSSYGLFVPTSLNNKSDLVLSALIECGEGTLTGLLRHLPPLSGHKDDANFMSPARLDVQLSHVCFVWVSHSHLDHYGDLPIVVQAIVNAKLKLGRIPQQPSDRLLVIAPSKVLKYLDVLLNQSYYPTNKSGGGLRQQMYVGVSHRELQYSPFARHLISSITDYAITIPTCADSAQHQAQNCNVDLKRNMKKHYNPFASLQNVEVEHCRDAFALILEINVPSNDGSSDGIRCNNPSRFVLCFSGDTRPSSNLIQKCRSYSPSRVNLLIHEGTFLDDPRGQLDAVRKRHCTTTEALDVAHHMNAEACILTHFSQRYRHISIEDASSGRDSYPFSWGVAFDGMMVPLTEWALSGLSRLSWCIDSLLQSKSDDG